MKKVLSLLLAFILIFSCFSILGTSAFAEQVEDVTNPVVMESDFDNSDGTNWQATHQNVTYGDDNGDGVNDYARVKISSTKSGAGLLSSPFNLIPGNEYELTYYIRVPEESVSFNIGSTFYTPTTAFYQPTVNSEGTRVTSTPAVTTVEATNNYYAYKGSNWSRREGFKATWTIDGYEPTVRSNFSNFGYQDQGSVLSATNANLNEAFAEWTKVTAKFTATAATEGETSQVTALGFTFHDYKSANNFVFDLKDVKLVNKSDGGTAAPTTPEGHAFFNAFEEGSVENIEADLSELRLVTLEDTDNAPQILKTKYLKYVSNNSSKGVAFNFTNNPNYKYKISYDLKVGAKGSGSLPSLTTIYGANTTTVFDHTNALDEWKHYEVDLTDVADYNGDVEVKLLADTAGWEVGIDNIKVEMVSNANLKTADDITNGTYAFNIRSQSDDKGQGLRVKSSISFNEINLDEVTKIVEYGTLVTVADNKENLKLENVNDKTVLKGVAYNADEKKDIRYSFDNDTGELVYTGVITGIEVQNYDKELAVCGYTVVETVSGARFVIYDTVKEISVLAAAEQIVAESQSEDDKAAAQSVINDYNALNP